MDHQAEALAQLPQQHKDSASLSALVAALSAQHSALDAALEGILLARTLSLATSQQLDEIGVIVGQVRNSPDDAVYRAWILARVAANRSAGRSSELYRIAFVVTGGVPSSMTESFPAAVTLTIGSSALYSILSSIAVILRVAKAAGVQLTVISPTSDDASSFALDDAAVPTGPGAGFGDSTNGATGGMFASAI